MNVPRLVMLFAIGIIGTSVLAIEVNVVDEDLLKTTPAQMLSNTSPPHLGTPEVDSGLTSSDEGPLTSSAGCIIRIFDPDVEKRTCSSISEGVSPTLHSTTTSRSSRTSLIPRGLPLINTGLISRLQYERVKFTTGCIMLVLPLIGIVMNSVNIAIFSSPQLKCPSSTILVCLSLAELFVIIIQMIARTVDFVLGAESVYSYVYLTVTKYLAIYASAVFGRTTYYLIFFVAAERLLAVAFPLRAKYYRLIQKRVTACGVILAVCASYHLYMPLMNTVVVSNSTTNATRYKLNRSSFFKDNRAVFASVHVLGEVVFVYVPLLSCLVLNVILIAILQRYGRRQAVLTSTQNVTKISHAERQITVTILVSTFIFIFLVLPKPLSGLVAAMRSDYGIYTKQHYLFLTVSKFAAVSNLLANCTNFLVYYTLGGLFRKTLHTKLCKRK